jgi:choline dehydrogenase-like flavoprotein
MLSPEYRAIMQQNPYSPPSSIATHTQNVLLGVPQIAKFMGDWVFRHKLSRRKLPYTLVPNADGSFPIEFNSEQAPREWNRVTLTRDVDRHGLRRVRVAWRLSDDEIAAARRVLFLFKNTINSSGVARFEFDEAQLEERLRVSPPLGGHHLGAARMGTSESDGVVDKNCAVFGIPNLFVASSAVFPTSGHANPTLTIIALAIRLAAHLDATLGGLLAHLGQVIKERDLPTETTRLPV